MSKYCVVEFETKTKERDYIVICSKWIESGKRFFYWPRKNWLSNKLAVKNSETVDVSTWIAVPIHGIMRYSGEFLSGFNYF